MKEKTMKNLMLGKKTISNVNKLILKGGALPTTKQTSLEKTFCLCVG